MMREADGDRLESIAEENNISAPAVRQRVSRLRRYLRERWSLQLAAALTAVALVVGTYAYTHRGPTVEPDLAIRTEPPAQTAKKVRDSALSECRSGHWQVCLQQLDRAKGLDPAGDHADAIVAARSEAERALQPVPAPAPSASEQRLVPAGDEPKSVDTDRQQVPQVPRPLHSRSKDSKAPKKPVVSPQVASNSAPNAQQSHAPQSAKKTQSKWSSDDVFDKK
jgi:hypothetical protein